MKAKTISHCQGKGSLSHNNRTFKAKNVDKSRSGQNVTFVKIPITEAYDKCFSEAVERYNAKQKRADRRIKDGYFRYAFSHAPSNNVITAADKRKSFYEDIVQMSDFGYCSETLYKKRTGEYFLYGKGGPMTIYACRAGDNSYGYGEDITPLSAKEARQWAEENLCYNDYVKEFGEPEE